MNVPTSVEPVGNGHVVETFVEIDTFQGRQCQTSWRPQIKPEELRNRLFGIMDLVIVLKNTRSPLVSVVVWNVERCHGHPEYCSNRSFVISAPENDVFSNTPT